MSFLGDLGLAAFNGGISVLGNQISSNSARGNLDYQMDRYYSPAAQVRNLAAAGINPAVAFGNQSPVFSGGGQFQVPSNPLAGIGTTSLTDLANYMNAKANVKKADADTRKADAEADAITFENELNRIFKQPERVVNIMAAYKGIQLQDDEHSINEWRKTKEKYLSELTGIERDSAKKTFDNMDTVIEQQNRQREEDIKLTKEKQKTEGTQQSANVAAARASNTQADVNEEEKRLRRALADIEESGSTFKLESLIRQYQRNNAISDADKKEAEIKLSRLKDLENNRDSQLFREVDSFLEWIKGKVSIFGSHK